MIKISYSALSAFDKCPRQYHEMRVLKSFPFVSKAADDGVQIHKHFEDRVKDKKPFPDSWRHLEPLMKQILAVPGEHNAEYRIKIDANAQPVPPYSRDFWAQAIIDFISLDRENRRAFMFDWKTGKSAYADLAQMKFSSVLLFASHKDIDTVNSALVFVKENKPVPMVYHRAEQLQYWEQILPLYRRLDTAHSTGVFNPKPSGLCKVCAVVTCEHNRNK